ncbi:MAG: ATP phosphoribosyltransferase regulatory subunit, partial [Planctomycetaceae bacterium]|nr:ATP phosphoribosyltransferase regulatory subunit [Planctomycetaceae bacterium]
REFMQWNVDFIGDAASDPIASDAEVIACCVEALMKLGLGPDSVTVRLGHKGAIQELFFALEINDPIAQRCASDLIDSMPKRSERQQLDAAVEAGISADTWHAIKNALAYPLELSRDDFLTSVRESPKGDIVIGDKKYEFHSLFKDLIALLKRLDSMQLGNWCVVDPQIVRGLAYYTGTVFEIHEASGAERAIAGGGRYDNLIESFGGPKLSACGFGMGDVVLANLLKGKGLLKPAEEYLPRPDAFVFAANDDAGAKVPSLVAELRRGGLHVRNSYKTTRNVGKLLGDAGKARARYAVILGAELAESPPRVAVKNLESGEQETIELASLATRIRRSTDV